MACSKRSLRRFHGIGWMPKRSVAPSRHGLVVMQTRRKCKKAVLKQQFEAFTISAKESLEKGYDRFQKLLSQLDALSAGVSDEECKTPEFQSPPASIQPSQSSEVKFLCHFLLPKQQKLLTPVLLMKVIHSFLATKADDVDLIHEDIDDSLYEYGKYGPQPQSPSPFESDASSTVYSTCQSNDSDGELGAVSDHSVNDDPIQYLLLSSLSHLIKNCDYYEKKMAREAALKSKRELHSQIVHVNSGTQFKSGASRFNTGKQHVSSVRVNRPVLNTTSSKPSQVNLNSPKKCFSKQRSPVNRPFSRHTAYKSNIYVLRQSWDTAVQTSAGCVWRKTTPLSNTNSGPTPDSNVNVSRGPQGRPKPVKAWVPKRN
ncbi:hypothetical protein Tco_1404862 [Tanacetum coccineum]